MAEASPTSDVLKEYYRAIKYENDEPIDEEKLEEYIQKLREYVEGIMSGDSDDPSSKIIKFPGSMKLH
jgi:hypothetical protein